MSDPFDALEPRAPAPAAGERRARRRRNFGPPRRAALVAQTLALRRRNSVANAFRLQAFEFSRSSWRKFGGAGRLGPRLTGATGALADARLSSRALRETPGNKKVDSRAPRHCSFGAGLRPTIILEIYVFIESIKSTRYRNCWASP